MGKKGDTKQQEMAKRMKDLKIIRKTMRCPVCNKIVPLSHRYC